MHLESCLQSISTSLCLLCIKKPLLHVKASTRVLDRSKPRHTRAKILLAASFCVPFILTSMGGLCAEGHDFLQLCRKRNKGATTHLLDVLVTQHAKWTAKRVRRGLFGQSIVDFTTASWSGIQLKESANDTASQQRKAQPKKTPRLLRSFAQARAVVEEKCSLVPGMSLYDDVEMEVGTRSSRRPVPFDKCCCSQ